MINDQSAKIKHGLSPKRNRVCYQTTQDIVIPAGTILRDASDMGIYSAAVGFGPVEGEFQIEASLEAETCGIFRKVMAA